MGASVPLIVTGEAIAPLPERVAPEETVSAAGLASVPATARVPEETLVVPV